MVGKIRLCFKKRFAIQYQYPRSACRQPHRPYNRQRGIGSFVLNKFLFILITILLLHCGSISAGKGEIIDTVYIIESDTSSIHVDRSFDENNLDKLTSAVIDSLNQQGYFYAVLNLERIENESGKIQIYYRLNKGPVVRLEKLLFKGLKNSDEKTVERYFSVKKGDTLTEQAIADIEDDACRIDYLHFNSPSVILPKAGYTEADLQLEFKEKRQFLFEGGAAVNGDNDNSLLWNLDLTLQNLFGKGRKIKISSDHRNSDRQFLNVTYSQPIFLAGVGNVGLSAATRDYRESFYEFSGDVFLSLSPGFKSKINADAGYRSVEPSNEEDSYEVVTAGLGINRQNLDYDLNPSSGMTLDWKTTFSFRKINSDSLSISSFNDRRDSLKISLYKNLFKGLVGSLSAGYMGLHTDQNLPPLSELYFIGGPRTLRGFKNEQFTAIRSALGTIEPHIRFHSGYLFGFFDAAYIYNRIDLDGAVKADEIYRFGYGGGISLISSERAVKIMLSWNKDLPFDKPWFSIELVSSL